MRCRCLQLLQQKSFVGSPKPTWDLCVSELKLNHSLPYLCPAIAPDADVRFKRLYLEYMDSIPILKRISIGVFKWAGDGVPNDAHYWGKQDFLTGTITLTSSSNNIWKRE